MNDTKQKPNKFLRALPTVFLIAAIALLIGLAFLPRAVGAERSSTANARLNELDPEAVRVLAACESYAAGSEFTADMNGTIKARVCGIPYKQNLTSRREVTADGFSETIESVSAFVKAGLRRSGTGDKYTVSRASYKKKSFVYPDPTEMTRDKYIGAYGKPNNRLTKYVTDGTLLSATRIDEHTFRYIFDPARATEFSRNEIRTVLSSESYPKYRSIELTLTADGDRAVKTVTTEKFFVDKFGGIECTATYTETFEYK